MALVFKSNDARVDGGQWRYNDTLSHFTVECWVNKTSNTGTIMAQYIAGLDPSFSRKGRFQVYTSAGDKITAVLTMTDSHTKTLVSTTSLSLNTWYHVAATFVAKENTGGTDYTVARLYVNGNLEAVISDAWISSSGMGDSDIILGNNDASISDSAFDGIIDEVRIWNTTRTIDQIQSYMNKRAIPGESGLERIWRLDEGSAGTGPSGTDVVDLTGAQNGTISSGTVQWTDGAPITK